MSQSTASLSSSPKRPRPSTSIVPAYIPPAALTPRTMISSIHTSPLCVQYIPTIDLAAGPFADLQDPTLDTDITAFNASPPLPPIASQPFIPARDLAWRAHLTHLQAWHALTVRITASELRTSHRIIVRELSATQVEEVQHLRAAHDRDLLKSQNRFAELFGRTLEEKNAEMEREGRERDGVIGRLRGQLEGLKGDMAHMHQLNLAQAKALGEERLKARKKAQVQRASEDPFARDDTDANTNTNTNTPSSPTISIHHPNNARRAKDIRSQQPTWSTLENLSLPAGGLPIRKARRELGLPTPRAMLETVRIIGGIDWLPDGVLRSIAMSVGGGSEREGMRSAPLEGGRGGEGGSVGAYRRGNGSVTRSGRRIERQGQGQGQTQGPRSARTLRDVEAEMMSRPLACNGERMGMGVGLGGSGSGSRSGGSYTVPPVEKKGEEGESEKEGRLEREECDTEAGREAKKDKTPAGKEQQVQESIDQIVSAETRAAVGAGSAKWGPGPSVLNPA